MSARWLVKSEPETYGFDHLKRDGRAVWDGVRNHAAAKHLKAMGEGDEVFVYHSGDARAVVGVAKVVRTAFPDASDPTGRFVAVELAPVRDLKHPVSLAQMKATPALGDMVILRQGRLSVSPISQAEWATILAMSESDAAG
jgi:predicted RNA-binding protein with PUA-like domain